MRSFLAAIFAIAFGGPRLLGCSCVQAGDPVAELHSHDAVFTGEVTAVVVAPSWWRVGQVAPPADLVEELTPGDSARVARVTIAVDRSWKGITREEVTVYTMFDCCMCGFAFQVGQRYLVYAAWSKQRGAFFVSACSRTKAADSAAAETPQLGEAKYDFQAARKQRQIQQLFPAKKPD